MVSQRVGDQHLARMLPVAGEHDEVPDRLAADVVVRIRLGNVAHRAIEIGGAQPGDHWDSALQVLAQQRRIEVAELERAAEPQELVVASSGGLQARPLLRGGLGPELGPDLLGRQREPCRIEDLEVVREQRDLVAAIERMVREKHVERAAAIEPMQLGSRPARGGCHRRSGDRSHAGRRVRTSRRRAEGRPRSPGRGRRAGRAYRCACGGRSRGVESPGGEDARHSRPAGAAPFGQTHECAATARGARVAPS